MIDQTQVKYIPQEWIIIKIKENNSHFYKIFGSWNGDYITGDSWQLNSGVVSVKSDNEFYYFFGESGSIYKCRKGAYGIRSMYNQGIINNLVDSANGKIEIIMDISNIQTIKW